MARTRADAKTMAEPVRDALRGLNAAQPVNSPVYLADILDQRSKGPRSGMLFIGCLAGIGLFIALMGVYGVVAFTVTERTREVGIRMAIGATRKHTMRMVIWQGARLIALGALPGVFIGTALLAAVARNQVILNISPFDPLTHTGTLLLVGGLGFLACAIPARKAAHLNPMQALRHE